MSMKIIFDSESKQKDFIKLLSNNIDYQNKMRNLSNGAIEIHVRRKNNKNNK